MSTLYDSDNPLSIPVGVDAAGYNSGYAASAWNRYGWQRFPNALRIAVDASVDGDVLDVEKYDATPSQTPLWVRRQNARGVVPWVYCNRATRPLVESALHSAGIAPDRVYMWIATLDGTKVVPPSPYGYRVAAVQWANSVRAGGHYDLSEVYIPFGTAGRITGDSAMTKSDFKALIITTYTAHGRTPESQAVIDGWAAGYDGNNADQIISKIVNSAEFVAYRKREAAETAATDTVSVGTKLNITGNITVVE